MKLELQDQLFIVTGASSGFGRSTAKALQAENATVIAVARREENLLQLQTELGNGIEIIVGDITQDETQDRVMAQIGSRPLSGLFINAGGPPAMAFGETQLSDWDEAYRSLLRWKVQLVKRVLPLLSAKHYGRIVFLESSTTKQPEDNLVLSNSLRLAVVGMVKSLSREVAQQGINLNILAPGYHATAAMERLFVKKSAVENITQQEARQAYEKQVPVGHLGEPDRLGELAAWLLSPKAEFITGQTISVDGGSIRYSLG